MIWEELIFQVAQASQGYQNILVTGEFDCLLLVYFPM